MSGRWPCIFFFKVMPYSLNVVKANLMNFEYFKHQIFTSHTDVQYNFEEIAPTILLYPGCGTEWDVWLRYTMVQCCLLPTWETKPDMVLYSVVFHCVVWYSVVWYCKVWYCTMWYVWYYGIVLRVTVTM